MRWSCREKNQDNEDYDVQDYIQEYYHLQHKSFCDHVKTVVDALEKIMELKDTQVTAQQRAAVRGLKAIYSGQLIEDIKRDLASGNVTMDTVEKRVQLDVDACEAVIDLLNPSPTTGKILLELILAEQANAKRTNLKNQVMWVKMQNTH